MVTLKTKLKEDDEILRKMKIDSKARIVLPHFDVI